MSDKNIYSDNTMDKPYVCDVCFKSFPMKQNMIQHKLIHNGIKPHVCTICNSSFKTLNQKNNHMKKHPMVWKQLNINIWKNNCP